MLSMMVALNVTTFAMDYPENLGDIVDGSVLTNEQTSEKF